MEGDTELELGGGETMEGVENGANCCIQQIKKEEYVKQGRKYSNATLEHLASTPEYQNSFNTCSTCNACWHAGCYTSGCVECGGFSLQRSCPVCDGRCGKIWNRSVDMSHKMKEAYWDGRCALPHEAQMFYLLRGMETNDDDLVEAMEDLKTS